jgi:hypothetical protein
LLLFLAVLSGYGIWRVTSSDPSSLAVDFNQYSAHARRWLATGELYLPHQLAGPGVEHGDPLYPPVIVYLLVPFLWLPAILWWIIPLAVTTVAIASFRPAAWTWPLLAFALLWPRTPALIYFGNPGMWVVAVIAAGLRFRWPGPLVLVKPSLAPFALAGFGTRGWLATLLLMAVSAIPLGELWFDYATVLSNAQLSLAYSLADLPFALAPVVAWMGRTKPTNSAWNQAETWRPNSLARVDRTRPGQSIAS